MQKLWHEHYDGDQHNTTQENLLAHADVYNMKQLKKTFYENIDQKLTCSFEHCRKTYIEDENIEQFEKTYVLTLPSPAIFFMGHLETVH